MSTAMTWTTGYEAPAYASRIELETLAAGAKTVAMFVAAPLLGLLAVIALPFAGLAALAWMGVKAMPKRAKDIALFAVAPFIGLVYVVSFPLIGVGAVVYAAVRAARAG